MAAIFSEQSPNTSSSAFDPFATLGDDVAHPNQISERELVVLGVSIALDGYAVEGGGVGGVLEIIRQWCFPYENQSDTPDLRLLKLRSGFTNHLGSFLDGKSISSLGDMLGSNSLSGDYTTALVEGADTVLERLLDDPYDNSQWTLLSAFLGAGRLGQEQRGKFRKIAKRIDFERFGTALGDDMVGRHILFRVSRHLPASASQLDFWKKSLLAMTATASHTSTDESLLSLVFDTSLRTSNVEKNVNFFAELLDALLENNRLSPSYAIRSVGQLTRSQHGRAGARLWRTLALARALERSYRLGEALSSGA